MLSPVPLGACSIVAPQVITLSVFERDGLSLVVKRRFSHRETAHLSHSDSPTYRRTTVPFVVPNVVQYVTIIK